MTEHGVELLEVGSVRVSVCLPGFKLQFGDTDIEYDTAQVWFHIDGQDGEDRDDRNEEQILVVEQVELEDLARAALTAEVVIRIRTGVTSLIDGARELRRISVLGNN